VFDFQILFDPSEESFNGPAMFVKLGDDCGRQIKIVGQKDKMFLSIGIKEMDSAKAVWITLKTFGKGGMYDFVADDAFFLFCGERL